MRVHRFCVPQTAVPQAAAPQAAVARTLVSRSVAALACAALLAACERGAEAPWLTMPSQAEHTRTFFPFGPGTTHPTLSCDDCHGAYDTFTRFDCKRCHGTQAELAGVHTGFVAYAYEDAACYTCHRDGTVEGIDHTSFFPTAVGSAHATARCADCHVDPASRAVLGCAGCHPHAEATLAPAHAAVPDYTFESLQCVRCHAESQVSRVAQHGPFPVAGTSAHRGADGGACLACHPATRTDKPWAADFARQACTGCHAQAATDPLHAGDPGYTWTTAACLGCHSDGTTVDHTTLFPIGAGTAHAGAACAECHTNASDRRVLGCAGCHGHESATMATEHAGVGGYGFSSALCVRCHAESQVTTLASHLPFRITAGAKHGGTTRGNCLTCHPAMRADKVWASDFSTASCAGCHSRSEMDSEHSGRPGYTYTTAACLNCHPAGNDD